MKTAEIREMATADLVERLQATQSQYDTMCFNHTVAPLANSASIKATRRDIARMKTILREREQSNQ